MINRFRNNRKIINLFYKLYSFRQKIIHSIKLESYERFDAKEIDASKDYCFIFGSGASVNRLESNNFDFIKENFSIGINQWFFHDFVTDLYFFEAGHNNDNNRQVEKVLDVVNDRREELSGSKIILPFESLWIIDRLRDIDNSSKLDYSYYSVLPFLFKDLSLLSGSIDFLRNSIFKYELKDLIFGSGSSVLRAVILAEWLGYKNIVLMGIDLGGEYFYEENSEYLKKWKIDSFSSNQENIEHLTESDMKTFKLSEILEELQNSYSFDARLLVPHSDSALSIFCDDLGW